MNQHLYAACRHTGYGQVCHLTDHLRKEHSLGEFSCRLCWRPFDNAGARAAHHMDTNVNACRETGGTPINRLRISKAHIGDYEKWFWVWDQLFPLSQKPKSPYWESFDHDDQLFSNLTQYMSAQLAQSLPTESLETVMTTLTRFREDWQTNPPEPRSLAPFPTPATTQGSDDVGRLNSQITQSSETRHHQGLPLSTQDLPRIDTNPLPSSLEGELNGDDNPRSPGLTNGVTNFAPDDHLAGEASLTFLDIDPHTWDHSQNYDTSFAFNSQRVNPDGFDNPDWFEWP
ncbi:hypothetical protein F4781DRAFT_397275 [Annulohypoxylon bovei var. microspora]|nr:hypothetical protein F4781DRAFT_397275 [Annulohypoxylon bovei var. microspora]